MILDEKLIEEQIDKATDKNGTYNGMTYEEGVRDALEWILYEENPPMDDE